MEVILLKDEQAEEFFEKLIAKTANRVARQLEGRIREIKSQKSEEQLYVSLEEAKQILGVKSKRKMQQLRDESPMNGIIISKHGRTIRYLKASLYDYLDQHVRRI